MVNEEVLRQFLPFNALDGQFLSQAAERLEIKTAKKGTLIFKRGKILTESFFLLEGQVDLINNEFGAEKVLGGSERARSALNQESPSTVSAIAKSPVTYFTLETESLDKLLADMQSAQVGKVDWMSCMLQSPLFFRIPLSQLQELFKKFESVPVKKDERVIREGAKGDYFYVLAAGSAVISDRSGSVNLPLKPGQYFGEEALISDSPRNASVTMTTPGLLKRLSAEDFSVLLKQPVLQYTDMAGLMKSRKSVKILDVRLPLEYRACHIPGSINIPLSRLRRAVPELSVNMIYAVWGEAGTRADTAAYLLCQAGFDAVVLNHKPEATRLATA